MKSSLARITHSKVVRAAVALICLSGYAVYSHTHSWRYTARLVPLDAEKTITVKLIPARTPYGRAGPRGVAWDGVDRLYVCDTNTTAEGASSVQAFALRPLGPLPLRWFGEVVRDDGRTILESPVGIAVTSAGVWLTDSDAESVYLLAHDSDNQAMTVKLRIDLDELEVSCPTDMTAAADGGAYVLLGKEGAILRVKPDGSTRLCRVPQIRGADGMTRRGHFAVRTAGSLLIAVGHRQSIMEIPLAGSGDILSGDIRTIVRHLQRPTDVACAPDGTLWIAEPGRGRVVAAVSDQARPSAQLDIGSSVAGAFEFPYRIATSEVENGSYKIAVADPGAGSVFVVSVAVKDYANEEVHVGSG